MRSIMLGPMLLLIAVLTGCTTTSVDDAISDAQSEALAKKRILDADPRFRDAHINVTSYNGVVLITGQVSEAELIPLATNAVEPLRAVSRVHNELAVAANTTLISRTNDSWITTKVKSALLADETAQASNIKVVTEDDVVYMMGLVSRAEADAAVEVVSEVQGVQKIVKVFDYIN